MNKAFQIRKVERLISDSGEQFTFYRKKKNKYGEFIDEDLEVITISGIFHQVNSYVTKGTQSFGSIRSKPQPMVLCKIEEANKIEKEDILEYAGKKYSVVDKTDLLEMNICVDISLEVIQDG